MIFGFVSWSVRVWLETAYVLLSIVHVKSIFKIWLELLMIFWSMDQFVRCLTLTANVYIAVRTERIHGLTYVYLHFLPEYIYYILLYPLLQTWVTVYGRCANASPWCHTLSFAGHFIFQNKSYGRKGRVITTKQHNLVKQTDRYSENWTLLTSGELDSSVLPWSKY